jgi:hypothetical protein
MLLTHSRELFGDEREDYAASLERHYQDGPKADWQTHFVSAYASAHPWEDWAETWAHYLHMTDTLETARAYGLAVAPRPVAGPPPGPPLAVRRLDPHYSSGPNNRMFYFLAMGSDANSTSEKYSKYLTKGAMAGVGIDHGVVLAAFPAAIRGAGAGVLAHNHPSGVAEPSIQDQALTLLALPIFQ